MFNAAEQKIVCFWYFLFIYFKHTLHIQKWIFKKLIGI